MDNSVAWFYLIILDYNQMIATFEFHCANQTNEIYVSANFTITLVVLSPRKEKYDDRKFFVDNKQFTN